MNANKAEKMSDFNLDPDGLMCDTQYWSIIIELDGLSVPLILNLKL
jgi:hypothetical protein